MQICSSTFYDCYYLSSVTIPPDVTHIQSFAFCGCKSLSSITIPPSIAQIIESAFDSCSSLSSIDIQSTIIKIKNRAFNDCKALKSFLLPEKLRSIQSSIFYECSNSLWNIFKRFFILFDDSMKNVVGVCEGLEGTVVIPEGIERIEKNAFYRAKVKRVKLPKSLRYIGDSAFANCSELENLVIRSRVEFIGQKAFIGERRSTQK